MSIWPVTPSLGKRLMIDGKTQVFGVFGDPITHSLSPAMHNAAFCALNINAVYLPFYVRDGDLERAVDGIRSLNLAGVNVTVPHKEKILPFLDEIHPDAGLIGAVNTVVNQNGRLLGFNTDSPGFLRSLKEDLHLDPRAKRVLVLGAGGACRAVLTALAHSGAFWIGLCDILSEKAAVLAREYQNKFPGTQFAWFCLEPARISNLLPKIDLLVNATPVGMRGETFDGFDWQLLSQAACVYDIVYAFPTTPLVRTVRDLGYKAVDGLGMLVAQGEEAFFLWHRKRPPAEAMKNGLLALIQRE